MIRRRASLVPVLLLALWLSIVAVAVWLWTPGFATMGWRWLVVGALCTCAAVGLFALVLRRLAAASGSREG